MEAVHAVVVTYRPDIEPLEDLLKVLSAQVAHIVIVDNTPGEDERVVQSLRRLGIPHSSLIRMGTNAGIAKALNVGIVKALNANASHVLLSDQDSLPASTMVGELLRALREVSSSGIKACAVGATFTDLNTGTTFPFQTTLPGRLFYGHSLPTDENPIVEALTLITSGTLIRADVFVDVGFMREDLFIDKVDLEWCLRARGFGYKLFGVGDAKMFHRLGDERLRVWYLGWRNETAYSPLRVYYQVRNYLALCRLAYVPWRWKIRNAWFTFGVAYSQIFFGKKKWATTKMVGRGLVDGVMRRMGPNVH